ncbi:MAG: hypothetical protein DMD62_03230 [Gemmatimonadetes bacterium]|nr:MAG: hypothetical protein DMD62_03230 [Gemmatimonadota bacterium]
MSRRASSDVGSPGLWFAVFGPPAAWFASLVVSYFAVHEVCRVHSPLAPRLVSLGALVIAVAAGVAGRGIWRGEAHERTRFMAQIGVMGGTVFSLIILLQIVATLLLPTCHERPRTPGSPDVFIAPHSSEAPRT